MTLIIFHHRCCYYTFVDYQKKKVSHNLDKKKLIKICQKIGKIIYLYKDVNVNFFIMFKLLSKLQELSCSKVSENLFGELYNPQTQFSGT